MLGIVNPRNLPSRRLGQELSVRGHLKVSNVSESDIKKGPGRVIVRGPRTLKYSKDPQLLDKGLQDWMERVMTLWGAPMDVERQQSPLTTELACGNIG